MVLPELQPENSFTCEAFEYFHLTHTHTHTLPRAGPEGTPRGEP